MNRARKAPMDAAEVSATIATMERETKSRTARKRMAEVALKYANVTAEGLAVWAEYLAAFK